LKRQEIRRQIAKTNRKTLLDTATLLGRTSFSGIKDVRRPKQQKMLIDYRKLSEKTVKDKYPMPNINDVLDRIGSAKYFAALDLARGYHQIVLDPRDVSKTDFSTAGGHFEFVKMPFGHTNAQATLQRSKQTLAASAV